MPTCHKRILALGYFSSNDHSATCSYCHLATSDQPLEIPGYILRLVQCVIFFFFNFVLLCFVHTWEV